MDPQAPSQPTQQTGLDQSRNPADKTSEEQSRADDPSSISKPEIDRREAHDVPSSHDGEANTSGLGYGDTGPLKEKDTSESKKMNYSNTELDGEQMRAPGEGEIADAVQGDGGGGHKGEEDLSENMDAKAKDHADALHARGQRTGREIEEEEKEDWTGKRGSVDLGAALEGRGPAVVLAAEE